MLDLACGTGDIAFELAAAGSRVVGLDITPRMLRLASLKPQRFRHHVSFVTGDMMALPFPDASFDVVTTGIRPAERSGSGRRAGARFTACCVPAGCCCRSTSTSPPTVSSAASISATSPPSARRSARSCTAIRTPTATFPNRFSAIRERPGVCALARQAGFAQMRPPTGARRVPRDALGDKVAFSVFAEVCYHRQVKLDAVPQPATFT